jgi:hypothetical protein
MDTDANTAPDGDAVADVHSGSNDAADGDSRAGGYGMADSSGGY